MNPARAGLLLALVTSTASVASAAPWLAKKDRYLAAKRAARDTDAAAAARSKQRWEAELRKRIGKKPRPLINIYNGHTEEIIPVVATPRAPITVPQSLIDRFLRCHFTNEPTHMDHKTFATMVKAARHFHSGRVIVISGFRSKKYNLSLIKKGHQVSRKSQHVKGKAIDFTLPGVSVRRLRQWCVHQGIGGVGVYPHSGFVHIDTGRVRYWSGR